jgi:RNA polymerase sigma-70 factor (ECF subfamily)
MRGPDRFWLGQGHWEDVVSANSATLWKIERSAPAARAPFRVARERGRVANWDVLSEPALPLRDLLSKARPASSIERALIEAEEASPVPLRFDEVFRRYAPYVGAIVLQLIGRPGDVDDVVQDVFMQAHKGLSRLRDPAAVRPWLRRIAVRRSRRWLRRRWVRRWFGEADVDDQLELADSSASPEERAQVAHVYRTLERMPKDERIAWVLKFVEGETLESIADLLGCSVSTVQRRLRAAQAVMGEIR